jgi:hypothetical protein
VQERNVSISLYFPPEQAGFMEPMVVPETTHAYFPVERFDEVDESGLADGIIFGTVAGTHVAILANHPLAFVPFSTSDLEGNRDDMLVRGSAGDVLTDRYDLVQTGAGMHAFVIELSSTDTETFAGFKARILANELTFGTSCLSYGTALDGDAAPTLLEATYDESFAIDGIVQDLQYARFESDYVANGSIARKADEIVFAYGGHTLTLNYAQNVRSEDD